MTADSPELARFLRVEIVPSEFPHREHVHIAFEMLRRLDFPETVLHFSRTLRAMAEKAGRPEAFHQTVTIAFLSLIAERMESGGIADFAAFAQANPDLLEKSALERWYRPERLASAAARRTFLLPDGALHGSQLPGHAPAAAALSSAQQAEAK
jgi:hypothetical protein